MAELSAVATARQGVIIQWCVNQINSPMYVELHSHDEGIGNLLRRRLQMLTAITLVPTDENGVHLLDDAENWKLLRREMKIGIGQFYSHANFGSWSALINPSNEEEDVPMMTERFYRSQLTHFVVGRYVIEPELVTRFPSISSYTLGVCRQHWGFIGGTPELSSNSVLKNLTMVLNQNEYEVDIISGQTQYYWSPGTTIDFVNVKAEAEDSGAKVEVTGDTLFTGLDDVDLEIKITAEDDSFTIYTFTFRSGATEDIMQSDTSIRIFEISLPDGTILPFTQPFDPATLTYILNIPDGTSTVNFNIVPGFSGATITLPSQTVNVDVYIKEFLVTSANGNHTESYNVLFVRNA